ncbi:MAG: lamin tail domain-containing protein [Anaerolineales bacterium]|nr:lamin tail domain-containing protein [Anaerolineales bacterium]
MFSRGRIVWLVGVISVIVLGGGILWSSLGRGPKRLSICEIQGPGLESPYLDQKVILRSVVSVDLEDQDPGGFFIQDDNCPLEDGGSQGIFIDLNTETDLVDLGDEVEVLGIVKEVNQETRILSQPSAVEILSLDHTPFPAHQLTDLFFIDPGTLLYENWEGMLVQVRQAVVLAPVGINGQFRIMPQFELDASLQMIYLADESLTLILNGISNTPRFMNLAEGDQIGNLVGVLRQNTEGYVIQALEPSSIHVQVVGEGLGPARAASLFMANTGTPVPDKTAGVGSGTPESSPTSIREPTAAMIPSPTYYPVHLLLTEIYPNPAGKEPDGEWLEIYNLDGYGLPLTGIKLGDEVSPAGKEGLLRFPDGYYIGGHEVLVIAHQAARFKAIYGFLPDFEIDDSDAQVPDMLPYELWGRSVVQLSNSGDEVLLVDPWDQIVDLVAYGNSPYGGFSPPVEAPGEGNSLERYPPERDRDQAGDWREREGGSPGRLDRSPPTQEVILTPAATGTPSLSPSPGFTETVSPSPTASRTSSWTATLVEPATITSECTQTGTQTITSSPVPSGTSTPFISVTVSPTIQTSAIPTMTLTQSDTPDLFTPSPTTAGEFTPTAAITPTDGLQQTSSCTPTPYFSLTPSPTVAETTSVTESPSATPTGEYLEDPAILINEIHADPDPLLGDANGDGLVHGDDDEFMELANAGQAQLDLGGWELHDGLRLRFTFPEGTTLQAGCGLVVFGGGAPAGDFGGSQIFTAGSLGLNNAGDTISLWDVEGIERIRLVYGPDGGQNQSLTRDPDLDGLLPLVLHSQVPEANGLLYSPGLKLDGEVFCVKP